MTSAPAKGSPAARYTHGHGPAVLAGPSRRTATDSAAYLLPRLRPGLDLLVDLLDNSLHGDSFTIGRGLREAHDRIAGHVALVEVQPWHRAGN